MIRKTAALLVLCAILAGCGDAREKAKIRQTVLRYNELLAKGYKDLDMTPLTEIATKDLALKSYYHMAAFGEGGLRIESSIKKIDFRSIDIQNDGRRAVAETEEHWDFAQRDIKTGKTFYEERNFIYDMGYELQKNGGSWTITMVNTLHSSSTATTRWNDHGQD